MKFNILCILIILTPTTPFIIHTASSCVSKHFKVTNRNISNTFQSNGLLCGEDDFIVSELFNLKFLTVVDGVGSWRHDGIDPKLFVSEFIDVLDQKFLALDFKDVKNHDNENNLMDLVDDSLKFLIRVKKNEINIGSCTIASMSINVETLHANAYHLGDAAYLIIRDGKIIFKSEDIMKKFNMPYQLGPPNFYSRVDDPKLGKIENFKLKVNDVIIIGSDGIFDNLFDDHILDVVHFEFTRKLKRSKHFGYSEAARKIAKTLTIEAKEIGESKRRLWTPFAANYKSYFGRKIYEGKNDDTTVVVGIISYE